jgi:hypothetical protein
LGAALPAALRRPAASLQPKYDQLTFHRGTLLSARFAPDGRAAIRRVDKRLDGMQNG